MVKEILENNKKIYMCRECCLVYKDRKIAKKCENWCKKNNSCNIRITNFALNKQTGGKK